MPPESLPHLILRLARRAAEISHHNYSELEIDRLTESQKAAFCFLLAVEESKNNSANQDKEEI